MHHTLRPCLRGSRPFQAQQRVTNAIQHIAPVATRKSPSLARKLTFRGRQTAAKAKNAPISKTQDAQEELEEWDGEEEEEVGEDGFLDAEDEDEEGVAAGFGGDDEALELETDDTAPGISTGNESWGETALKAAQKVLRAPVMDGIELYLFRALVSQKKLDIRLDKLSDIYGSPSIDDIEKFSRLLYLELEASMGTEAAGEISLEVSSPGAERELRLPQDLARFQELPMRVDYTNEAGVATTQVLSLAEYDEPVQMTMWRLADAKVNMPTKGRGLSKKQRELKYSIPVSSLKRVKIHVDF